MAPLAERELSPQVPAPYRDGVLHLTTLWMLSPMTAATGTILLPRSHASPTNPSVPGVLAPHGAHRDKSDRHFRKAATEYDKKPGIKRLSRTAK